MCRKEQFERELGNIEAIGSVAGLYIPDAPTHIDHNFACLYFENQKRSGGSENCVENVEIKHICGKPHMSVTIRNKEGKNTT